MNLDISELWIALGIIAILTWIAIRFLFKIERKRTMHAHFEQHQTQKTPFRPPIDENVQLEILQDALRAEPQIIYRIFMHLIFLKNDATYYQRVKKEYMHILGREYEIVFLRNISATPPQQFNTPQDLAELCYQMNERFYYEELLILLAFWYNLVCMEAVLCKEQQNFIYEMIEMLQINKQDWENLLRDYHPHNYKIYQNQTEQPYFHDVEYRAPDPDLAVLGLNPPVSWEQIKERYRELVKQHHPDMNTHRSVQERQKIEREFKKITEAYQNLSHRYQNRN
ncbi:MAG: J domain-containing protein [Bacteroidia bacterium]|nr:J domain-containing protein [Bacteroidia bacterium]MDW8346697.1 J domain-containing protein [Bacteroidia bacterium]